MSEGMKETSQSNILLESGTNELEIVMYKVGGETFGINVLKVREIIQPLPVTKTPQHHQYVEGVFRLRQEVIPVVNLAKVLGYPPSPEPNQDKFIIGELNKVKVAFHVQSVSRIHRISWEQIEKPSELSQGSHIQTIGVIKLEDEIALLLDYERILMEISPQVGIHMDQLKALEPRDRSSKKIVIAEDSPILRKMLEDTLQEAGYMQLSFFENGQDAWEFLDSGSHCDLLITDLEMPKMDGHHLTYKIRRDQKLKELPVIIFSSLITEDLFHKGEKVGASAQISKPEIVELVETIDQHIE
ncbi:chemotaxis protein [Thalassorhabdus alkalitolerans]|uniref:Chemotaxis protein n=2 Tax=Thalassorhabdus alkalitolerans TaxID=2282697 RepID=A0ABW0YN95_9BACI